MVMAMFIEGVFERRSTWRPMPCSGAIPARDVQLNWPTELAVSPLDSTLHFIDDNVVLKMTHDGRVSIVAGQSVQIEFQL